MRAAAGFMLAAVSVGCGGSGGHEVFFYPPPPAPGFPPNTPNLCAAPGARGQRQLFFFLPPPRRSDPWVDPASRAAHLYTMAEPAAMEMGTIFATNQHIRICPGDTNVSFETHCATHMPGGATIIAANGHFHSRGTQFTMNIVDAMGNDMLTSPFY